MGNYWSSPEPASSVVSRKRSLDEISEDSGLEKVEEQDLHTPKRKKLKSTSKYIYDTLFVNGESSDVTVVALGRKWKLHKVYLCQCCYFCGMFNGSWKEATQSLIHMDIPDDNIDVDALEIAFGSLYRDDVTFSPAQVISVLATATLLGLDGLIDQCANMMRETMSAKTVLAYNTASVMYGQQSVTDACMDWLHKNLMANQTSDLLADIGPELMEKLVGSPGLFVMQVEMDIYTMLKKWAFLQHNPGWTGSIKELVTDTDAYFKKLAADGHGFYLISQAGEQFMSAFKQVRYQHILNDLTSARLLEQDRIVPHNYLLPLYRAQWHQMLKMEQGQDKGPESIDLEAFPQESMRCGRVLHREGEYCWRWTGYNFGVDLLMSFTNKLVILKRNTYSQTCAGSVSLQAKRNYIVRVTVASLNGLGQSVYLKDSGKVKVTLGKDEEVVIMNVDPEMTFPLHVSANWLAYTPIPGLMPKDNTEPGKSKQTETSSKSGSSLRTSSSIANQQPSSSS